MLTVCKRNLEPGRLAFFQIRMRIRSSTVTKFENVKKKAYAPPETTPRPKILSESRGYDGISIDSIRVKLAVSCFQPEAKSNPRSENEHAQQPVGVFLASGF